MKSLFFLIAACSFFASCNAQKIVVPPAVTAAFSANHPDIKKVAWETEDDGSYEAEFKVKGAEISENYAATGLLLETEVEIKKKALPAAVLLTIARDFPDHELEEAARITYPDGQIVYEAELEGEDDVTFDATFTADGLLVEKKLEVKKDKD